VLEEVLELRSPPETGESVGLPDGVVPELGSLPKDGPEPGAVDPEDGRVLGEDVGISDPAGKVESDAEPNVEFEPPAGGIDESGEAAPLVAGPLPIGRSELAALVPGTVLSGPPGRAGVVEFAVGSNGVLESEPPTEGMPESGPVPLVPLGAGVSESGVLAP
jgi:hypothetical protein